MTSTTPVVPGDDATMATTYCLGHPKPGHNTGSMVVMLTCGHPVCYMCITEKYPGIKTDVIPACIECRVCYNTTWTIAYTRTTKKNDGGVCVLDFRDRRILNGCELCGAPAITAQSNSVAKMSCGHCVCTRCINKTRMRPAVYSVDCVACPICNLITWPMMQPSDVILGVSPVSRLWFFS